MVLRMVLVDVQSGFQRAPSRNVAIGVWTGWRQLFKVPPGSRDAVRGTQP